MKTNLLFGLIALALTTASASAAEIENRRQLFEFNFTCKFENDLASNSAETSRFNECFASAQVFAFVDRDDLASNMSANNFVRNKLAVQCGDQLIYADGAFLNPERRFVSIRGINGFPAIFVKRHRDEVSASIHKPYRAFLDLGNRSIPGFCEVRNRPVYANESSNALD